MFGLPALIRSVCSNTRGSVVIETAIVAPVLVLLSLGTFDVSRMVARQHELQTGATDLEGIVLAVAQGSATDVNTIRSALSSSLNLPLSKVTVAKVYRCASSTTLVAAASACSDPSNIAVYVQVNLTDTYTPIWTKFGVGSPLNYNLVRTVQVS
jgi:Flp pilus assembly protein TadG